MFFQHYCFIFVDPFTCLLIWSSVVYIAWKDWPGVSFEINAETSNPTNYSFRRRRRGERGRERENESQKTLSSGKCSYNVRICCCSMLFLIIFWNCFPRLCVERRNCMQLSSHDLRLTHALVNLRHSKTIYICRGVHTSWQALAIDSPTICAYVFANIYCIILYNYIYNIIYIVVAVVVACSCRMLPLSSIFQTSFKTKFRICNSRCKNF